MSICLYFIEFMIYSFMGWVHECLFCMVKEHHWENRGFLFGPICPIYGVGGTIGVILIGKRPFSRLFLYLVYGTPLSQMPPEMPYWCTFLLGAVSATILEYATSVFLEKKFHARWWDYSDTPLNFNGRICIPATIGFGLVGMFAQWIIVPLSTKLHNALPANAGSALALIFMALFTADLVLTIESLKQITEKLVKLEDRINRQLQAAYESVEGAPAAVKAMMRKRILGRIKEHAEVTEGEMMTLKRMSRLSLRGAGGAAVKNVIRLFSVRFIFIRKGDKVSIQKTTAAEKKKMTQLPEEIHEEELMQEEQNKNNETE